jgi:bifunctional DNA-binding transcriptional regulator/antitoxin component of YhaV-PrlF toxin-antitoxin module
MEEELVKMSGKGQLVVPQKIRRGESFRSSDRFIAIEIKGGVLFKRIDVPKVRINFAELSREIEAHLKERDVGQGEVAKAVRWARKK